MAVLTIRAIRSVPAVSAVADVDDFPVRHRELIAVGGLGHGSDVASLLLSIHDFLDGLDVVVQTLQCCHALVDTVHALAQLVDAALVIGTCHGSESQRQYHPFNDYFFIHTFLLFYCYTYC